MQRSETSANEANDVKCGLEIHQRICDRKLFCNCTALMPDSKGVVNVNRVLHPAVGETGELDKAVLFESIRDKKFTYHVSSYSACLVDVDSEPPHVVNRDALLTALSVARNLKMFIPDELHVMRKTVIDGSNTGGFQRTMVVGLGSKDSVINTSEGPVRVKDLELEEESARIVSRDGSKVTYDLAGLGVPLIEIGTHADIKSASQAYEVAIAIGELLRLTGNAQRGIGTIRQDVNVSVSGGARVEIKGFQDVRELAKLVNYEVVRQESLIALKSELTGYEIRRVNVSGFFEKSKSRVVAGKKYVIGLILPGFKGLLASKLNPAKTLGSELADYARSFGVKGMIHEDEDLAKYDLVTEFSFARNEFGLKASDLLLVISGDDEAVINRALDAVTARVNLLNDGVPEETRVAAPDATSVYARPLPGGARMYPETDVPVIPITGELLKSVPVIESKEARISWLKSLKLPDDLVSELVLSPKLALFRVLVSKFDPLFVARLIITIPKDVKRRYSVDVSLISDDVFSVIASRVSSGVIDVKAVPEILSRVIDAPTSIDEVIGEYELLSDAKLKVIVKKVLSANKGLSAKALMGLVMKEVRGRASGEKISKLVSELVK